MKFIRPIILGFTFLLISLLSAFVGPVLAPFLLPFIKWDNETSLNRDGLVPAIRGEFPRWLSLFQSPDERLPGDLTNPSIYLMWLKYGKWITALNWAFIRNRVAGLSWFAKIPAGGHFEQKDGYQCQSWAEHPEHPNFVMNCSDVWHYEKTLGKIKFVCGYEVFKIDVLVFGVNHQYWATPTFTFKRS